MSLWLNGFGLRFGLWYRLRYLRRYWRLCVLTVRAVVLLHEFQLFFHGITSLSKEVELRADVLVFVIGRGGDL